MKLLLVMRHAKSSWKYDDLADHDRPLKKRGISDAEAMGKHLKDKDLTPHIIIASTAERARKTAKIVAEASHYNGDIVLEHGFYHAGPIDYIRALQHLDETIQLAMVIGHNPGLEVLLEVLTGESEWLSTSAVALVKLPINAWSEVEEYLEGELAEMWTPRELVSH